MDGIKELVLEIPRQSSGQDTALSLLKMWVILYLVALHSMWDLSSSTREQIHAPCSGSTES